MQQVVTDYSRGVASGEKAFDPWTAPMGADTPSSSLKTQVDGAEEQQQPSGSVPLTAEDKRKLQSILSSIRALQKPASCRKAPALLFSFDQVTLQLGLARSYVLNDVQWPQRLGYVAERLTGALASALDSKRTLVLQGWLHSPMTEQEKRSAVLCARTQQKYGVAPGVSWGNSTAEAQIM